LLSKIPFWEASVSCFEWIVGHSDRTGGCPDIGSEPARDVQLGVV
jgi:hypothetical protein